MARYNNLQCGQYVNVYGIMYMFMGYKDYKKKIMVLADRHGNVHSCGI
jgi:hypothetical protein